MKKLTINEAIDFILENAGRFGSADEKAQDVAQQLKDQIQNLNDSDADLDDVEIFI